MKRSFIFIGSPKLPWIHPLLVEVARRHVTVAVDIQVWRAVPNRTRGPATEEYAGGLKTVTWWYPPGYAGRLDLLCTPIVRARLRRLIYETRVRSGAEPYLVTPYPDSVRYLRGLCGERIVYWNYDDYASYVNGCRAENPFEHVMIEAADTVLCSSAYQRRRLANRLTASSHKLFHFPHGVQEPLMDGSVSGPYARTVCVIGSLTPRYDWRVIEQVVGKLPDVRFVFVGKLIKLADVIDYKTGATTEWLPHLREVLSMKNVVHIDQRAHEGARLYYTQCAASWLPYDVDHPFVKASCPLKLTDGAASGRPVISADVPECRLHPEWISIYKSDDEAVALIEESLSGGDSVKAQKRRCAQVEFARKNTWAVRAQQLVEILQREGPSGE